MPPRWSVRRIMWMLACTCCVCVCGAMRSCVAIAVNNGGKFVNDCRVENMRKFGAKGLSEHRASNGSISIHIYGNWVNIRHILCVMCLFSLKRINSIVLLCKVSNVWLDEYLRFNCASESYTNIGPCNRMQYVLCIPSEGVWIESVSTEAPRRLCLSILTSIVRRTIFVCSYVSVCLFVCVCSIYFRCYQAAQPLAYIACTTHKVGNLVNMTRIIRAQTVWLSACGRVALSNINTDTFVGNEQEKK